MKVSAKVPPVDMIFQQVKTKLNEQIGVASLAAVQSVIEPIRKDLEELYGNLPVAHPDEQARHRRKTARRRDGTARKHVYADIIAKADNYRQILGAWAVVGAESRQPHLHLIELGTTDRYTSEAHGRKFRGRMPVYRVVRKTRDNRLNFIIDKLKAVFEAKWNSINN